MTTTRSRFAAHTAAGCQGSVAVTWPTRTVSGSRAKGLNSRGTGRPELGARHVQTPGLIGVLGLPLRKPLEHPCQVLNRDLALDQPVGQLVPLLRAGGGGQ